MKRVSTVELRPGMVTADDVFSYNNQLILPRGLVLTDKTITKLAFYSVIDLWIEDKPVQKEIRLPSTSYSERIRNSEEFKRFKDNFETDAISFKNSINDVVEKGAPLNADQLMEQTMELISSANNSSIHIFDLLHNMRQYDDSTYIHCINTSLICYMFAQWLQFDEKQVRIATLSGLLHDVGKTLIPEQIIKKPGRLTNVEYNIIMKHTQSGYEILKRQDLDDDIRQAALLHHERCDGSGYPFGYHANQINSYAKLVSIVDVYDAMTSARIYRGPLCPFTVIGIFESEGLQKYDTHYIMTFMENVLNTYLLHKVRLSNGVEGEVVYINRSKLSAPTIKCGTDFIDLSKERDITIECLL